MKFPVNLAQPFAVTGVFLRNGLVGGKGGARGLDFHNVSFGGFGFLRSTGGDQAGQRHRGENHFPLRAHALFLPRPGGTNTKISLAATRTLATNRICSGGL